MIRPTLAGKSILVVEDEPLVAMDIAMEFESRGARVALAHNLKDAQGLIEADGLSAAILDHGLQDGNSTQLCERLAERHIPFVTYSGYHGLDGPCTKGVVVEKPAPPSVLVSTIESLLR
jgi:DNA-binding response OmpR family regulator